MSFLNARLLECVTFGTSGGPTWFTRKVSLRSGVTRRNANRAMPLYRYSVLYRNLLPEFHQAVIDAYNACLGGVHSFRFKDWADFEADEEVLPDIGTGSAQEVQLYKAYTFGGETLYRRIRKPVPGTVTMYADGVEIPATVDYDTGVVTLTATIGDVLSWSGEFDVPVMFEDDELQFSGDDKGVGGLFLTSNVALCEDIAV